MTDEPKTEAPKSLVQETADLLERSHAREEALAAQLAQVQREKAEAEQRHAAALKNEPEKSRIQRLVEDVEAAMKAHAGRGRVVVPLGRIERALKSGACKPPEGARLQVTPDGAQLVADDGEG